MISPQIAFKLSWYSQAQFRVCYNMLKSEIQMEVFRKMICWLYISGECDTEGRLLLNINYRKAVIGSLMFFKLSYHRLNLLWYFQHYYSKFNLQRIDLTHLFKALYRRQIILWYIQFLWKYLLMQFEKSNDPKTNPWIHPLNLRRVRRAWSHTYWTGQEVYH